jgi:hypothetical protein
VTTGRFPAPAWLRLGQPAPEEIRGDRMQLHRAVQVVAAFAASWLEAAPGDGHKSLEWLPGLGALATRPAGAVRAALALAEPALLVVAGEGSPLGRFPLAGRTLEEAHAWLEATARPLIAAAGPLAAPEEPDLEPGPGSPGRPFRPDPRASAELARWYGNADVALRQAAAGHPDATPVVCWPHGFDIAFQVPLGTVDGQPASLGVGMTPGDGTIPDPYWYVTPDPTPEVPPRPDLPGGGGWHDEGWFGAVLRAEELLADDSGPDQAARARSFLAAALAAARDVVHATGRRSG